PPVSITSCVFRKGGGGFQAGCHKLGDRGDWIDVTPRRRKVFRQDDRSYDRQRWLKRHGGER
ncbi:hypothetical protein A2U01_0107602, partial [Trifolium medium]|nr:hypothetical protein [Trifolium medium]